MAKEIGKITWYETDDGIRIDISGEKAKEALGCCCLPCVPGQAVQVACCEPAKEKKE